MNKDISLYYTVKLDEISKIQRALIENLKKDLTAIGKYYNSCRKSEMMSLLKNINSATNLVYCRIYINFAAVSIVNADQ